MIKSMTDVLGLEHVLIFWATLYVGLLLFQHSDIQNNSLTRDNEAELNIFMSSL